MRRFTAAIDAPNPRPRTPGTRSRRTAPTRTAGTIAARAGEKDLAERLGVTRNSVGNIERGQQNVTLGMLCWFADALEMTVKELMFGAPARR